MVGLDHGIVIEVAEVSDAVCVIDRGLVLAGSALPGAFHGLRLGEGLGDAGVKIGLAVLIRIAHTAGGYEIDPEAREILAVVVAAGGVDLCFDRVDRLELGVVHVAL